MQQFYFDKSTGRCLGSIGQDTEIPKNAAPALTEPLDGRQAWNIANSAWQWPVDLAIARKIAAIKQRLDQALLSVPCPLASNRPIQLDKDSQGNIGDATQQATVVKGSSGAVAWPARMISRGWRLADNSWYPLAAPDNMIALGLWAAQAVEQRRDVAWSHIDAVRAMTDPAVIVAYDIETGW